MEHGIGSLGLQVSLDWLYLFGTYCLPVGKLLLVR